MKYFLTIFLSIAVAVFETGCSRVGERSLHPLPADRPIRVVTTTGMITDLVRNIGGERVEVTGLMGPGVDPHLYKASEGDVRRMTSADMIVYNGAHLEGKMTEIFEKMEKRRYTYGLAGVLEAHELLTPPAFKGAHDPHIWFSVRLWMNVGKGLRDYFIKNDSTHAEIYRKNAETYLMKLLEMNDYVHRRALTVPKEKRVLITAHDAFNYFGREYGFTVRGLQGISTTAEAGTGDVQDLAKFIAERQIPAVFVETSVPERYIEALQAAVRSRGYETAIGGNLFSDAMGNPGTPEGTYIGMVKHNIDTIVNALNK